MWVGLGVVCGVRLATVYPWHPTRHFLAETKLTFRRWAPRINRGESRLAIGQSRRQIFPIRIVFFNQIDLPLAFPGFDPAFALQSGWHRVVALIPDELGMPVFGGEDGSRAALVLIETRWQVGGYAAIKRAILAISEQIDRDEIKACHRTVEPPLDCSWFTCRRAPNPLCHGLSMASNSSDRVRD